MSEVKVYIEAYDALWEVWNPTFEADGAVSSNKYRQVGERDFYESTGRFVNSTVYEETSPEGEALVVPVLASSDVVAVTGQIGDALQALVDIAYDERVDAYARIDAATRVIATYLDLLEG